MYLDVVLAAPEFLYFVAEVVDLPFKAATHFICSVVLFLNKI